jgi:hypothetical protein
VEGKGVLGVRALEEGRNGGAGGKNQSRCGGGDEESGSRGILGNSRGRCYCYGLRLLMCGDCGEREREREGGEGRGMSAFARAWLLDACWCP